MHLIFGDDMLGSFWKQPGRTLASTMLKDVHFNDRLFKDTEEVYFGEKALKGQNPETAPMYLSTRLPLYGIKEYMKTWSSYYSWKGANPDSKEDVMDVFIRHARSIYSELRKILSYELLGRLFGCSQEESDNGLIPSGNFLILGVFLFFFFFSLLVEPIEYIA